MEEKKLYVNVDGKACIYIYTFHYLATSDANLTSLVSWK